MKKIYLIKNIFWSIIVLFIISGCKKTADSIAPSLNINTSSKLMTFSNDGGSTMFNITTNASWRVVNPKNNLSTTFYEVSPTSGTINDSTIHIKVNKNIYPYTRYDTLYFIAGNAIDTVFIEQMGITSSGTLLVAFKNLHYIAGVDSIVTADITLADGVVHTNVPIDATDNASFRSNDIPITPSTKIVAAVFKNEKGKIRNWWNNKSGENLPTSIDINNAKYYFSGGDGGIGNPYIISNPAQMNNLRKSYHEGEFIIQDRDIDFTDATGLVKLNEMSFDFSKSDTFAVFYNNQTGWIPIGIAGGGLPFKGNYNGNKFKIKGLCMNRISTLGSSKVTGLFGVVTGGVENVIIENNSLFLGGNSVGSIVGNLQGGSIKNCGNYAIVKGAQFVGGIVGSMNGGTIENSFNRGGVIATSHAGGLVGGMYENSTMKNCYNNANVTGNWWIGGLLGNGIGNASTISNSYNAGEITTSIDVNTTAIGGIVGGLSKGFDAITFQNGYYLQEDNINNINGVGGNTTTNGITPSSTSALTNAILGLGTDWKLDDGQNQGFPILNWQ